MLLELFFPLIHVLHSDIQHSLKEPQHAVIFVISFGRLFVLREYWHQSFKWSDSFFCVCARCSKQLLLPPFANRLRGKLFLGIGIRTIPHTLTSSHGNLKTLLAFCLFVFMLLLAFKESFLIIMATQDILRGHLVCSSITVCPSISVNLSCPDLVCLSSWL